MIRTTERTGGRPRRILITGGGTGGHVYPGLAVAEALAVADPRVEIRFAGRQRGIEADLARRAGHRFHGIPASGFRGRGLVARIRALVDFAAGSACALGLLLRWRPDVVLGTGGYVSAPVLAAAGVLGRPCAVQEQNAVPGSTNRLLGRWARRIYLGFAAAEAYFEPDRCMFTGNPVRAAFADVPDEGDDRRTSPPATGRDRSRELRVLVFGGSLGAHTLNEAVRQAAPRWAEDEGLALWAQTGQADRTAVAEAYGSFGPRARIDAFIHEMPAALDWADLAVCRAGAMTLAELAAVGRAAVLVPFPHATDDHQSRNAERCREAGAALVLADADCDGESLADFVRQLRDDPDRRRAMGAAARGRHRPDAAGLIARDLLALAGGVQT